MSNNLHPLSPVTKPFLELPGLNSLELGELKIEGKTVLFVIKWTLVKWNF